MPNTKPMQMGWESSIFIKGWKHHKLLITKLDIFLSHSVSISDFYRGLIHWGQMTHTHIYIYVCVCVISKLTIIGSDNGFSPSLHQAIIWINAGILLIQSIGIRFSEILIEILIFSCKKTHLKVSSAKCWPFCLGLNMLRMVAHALWSEAYRVVSWLETLHEPYTSAGM